MRQEPIGPSWFLSGKLTKKQGGGKKSYHTVCHGDIDILPFAGISPGQKSQKDSNGRIHATAGNVSDLNSWNGGGVVFLTDEIKDPGIAEVIDIVPDPVAERSVLSVPGNRDRFGRSLISSSK